MCRNSVLQGWPIEGQAVKCEALTSESAWKEPSHSTSAVYVLSCIGEQVVYGASGEYTILWQNCKGAKRFILPMCLVAQAQLR